MYRIGIFDASPGMRLAVPVYNERGEMLLRANVELTSSYLQLLNKKGLRVLWVHDDDTADISVVDLLSEHLRSQANVAVHGVLVASQAALGELRASPPAERLRYIESAEFKRVHAARFPMDPIEQVAGRLVEALRDVSPLGGLFSALRSADNYLYTHSVDTAVLAVLIGRRLHRDRTTLRRLALGCLLHDLGMALIDPTILHQPGPLSPDQWLEVQQHPTLGYALLMQVQQDRLAIQAALQHHERQDGKGYPRGLIGTNRVVADVLQRSLREMTPIAEIAAVADAYDALISARPYRPDHPPEEISTILRSHAGTHLNAQLLEHLLELVPPYPVGTEVVITRGPIVGCLGVVSQIDPKQPRRPVVRLLYDRAGERMRPVDLDLRKVHNVIFHSRASLAHRTLATRSIELPGEVP